MYTKYTSKNQFGHKNYQPLPEFLTEINKHENSSFQSSLASFYIEKMYKKLVEVVAANFHRGCPKLHSMISEVQVYGVYFLVKQVTNKVI